MSHLVVVSPHCLAALRSNHKSLLLYVTAKVTYQWDIETTKPNSVGAWLCSAFPCLVASTIIIVGTTYHCLNKWLLSIAEIWYISWDWVQEHGPTSGTKCFTLAKNGCAQAPRRHLKGKHGSPPLLSSRLYNFSEHFTENLAVNKVWHVWTELWLLI